jgi:AcrR family transcriptional regulator
MREKIKETAAHLYALKGYNATSMREIAKEVGVTKASLYYYYESKEELFFDIVKDSFAHLVQMSQQLADSDQPVWSVLSEWVDKIISFSKVKKDNWMIINKFSSGTIKDRIFVEFNSFWKESFNYLSKILKKGIDEGMIRKDVDISMLTGAVFGILHGCCTVIYRENIKIDDNQIKTMILGILEGGIASHETSK